MDEKPYHVPVLAEEVARRLGCRPGGVYVDCTVGTGGHAEHLLRRCPGMKVIIGLDVDEEALAVARKRLQEHGARARLLRCSFEEVKAAVRSCGYHEVDGVLYDLGVSSPQLDTPARGFSIRRDGPLDMRMDREGTLTAAAVVTSSSREELEGMLRQCGEVRWARRIARAIVQAREERLLGTTQDLAEVVKGAIPARFRPRRIHPATRTFLALRIAVNKELEVLPGSLRSAVELLSAGGRLCVISYHSLEDRVVKQFFRETSRLCKCPPEVLTCTCGRIAQLKVITGRPITPAPEERAANRRARSAKLRVAEKL